MKAIVVKETRDLESHYPFKTFDESLKLGLEY